MAEPTTAEQRRAERLARFRVWLDTLREELKAEVPVCVCDHPWHQQEREEAP